MNRVHDLIPSYLARYTCRFSLLLSIFGCTMFPSSLKCDMIHEEDLHQDCLYRHPGGRMNLPRLWQQNSLVTVCLPRITKDTPLFYQAHKNEAILKENPCFCSFRCCTTSLHSVLWVLCGNSKLLLTCASISRIPQSYQHNMKNSYLFIIHTRHDSITPYQNMPV